MGRQKAHMFALPCLNAFFLFLFIYSFLYSMFSNLWENNVKKAMDIGDTKSWVQILFYHLLTRHTGQVNLTPRIIIYSLVKGNY